MSPQGSASLQKPHERPSRRALWPFLRRHPSTARRRVRVRWGRLVLAGGAALAVLALGMLLSRLGALPGRSPFESLLPEDTPLAVEGEASAVLDLLSRTPPLGPQVIDEFRLSHRRAAGKRMVFALLRRSGADVDAADRCRQEMASVVTALEDGWEARQAYPSAGPAFTCPSGGTATYLVEGEDFVLKCSAASHTVVYDSRSGFQRQAERGPAVLVGLERAEEEGGTQFLCSQPELLDRLLKSDAPRLDLPGPGDVPLRAVGDVESMETLIQAPWPAMAAKDRVLLWGDPAEERWSLRLPLAAAQATAGGEVAEALRELPPAHVAMAAAPGFLRLLAPALAEDLALSGADAPGSVGVAMEQPLCRSRWREELARRLAGRGGTVVAASFPNGDRLERWVRKTPWAGVLAGASPGAELEKRDTATLLRLGDWSSEEPPRPTLPSGDGEAALAGWVTVQDAHGRRAIYCFAAGPDSEGTWMEICREEAPPGPPQVARDEAPVIQSR